MEHDGLSATGARDLPDRFLVAFSFAGEQRTLVREIAEAVEKRIGASNVFFDEWFEYYISGHDADLKLQEIYGDRCALAVVCVSERYGDKPWTQAENEAIRARLMKARASVNPRERDAILPIRVGDGDIAGVPFNAIVPDVRNCSRDAAADLIVQRLRFVLPGLKLQSDATPVAPSWPGAPGSLRWPVADHDSVRGAFASLLAPDAPWRLLPVRGPFRTGKTRVAEQMLANALSMPDLACGRFDFKGTTDLDIELGAFIQHLDVDPPAPSPRLNERLARIFDALKCRARPTLLIFDTYEAAGETRDWVEKQLLPSLVRAAWLRVVIAGQRVPESAGAVWSSAAHPTIELVPPQEADWLEYGRQYRPELTLAEVQIVCGLVPDRADLLSQLLGPRC